MPILNIRHVTTYHYHQPVAFGEHRMMLLPRDDDDQKVLHSEIEITPKPLQFDLVARRFRQSRGDGAVSTIAPPSFVLSATSASTMRRPAFTPPRSTIARAVIRSATPRTNGPISNAITQPPAARRELDRWSAGFFRNDGSADTHDLLVDMTRTIRRTFKHVARHQKGVQDPLHTLALGSGSCRDLAVLMIAALRSRGIAARFVSGYVHLALKTTTRTN